MNPTTLQEFIKAGCTQEQALKIFAFYAKDYIAAFETIDIPERIEKFEQLFAPYGKSKQEIIERIALFPSLFSRTPETLDDNITQMAQYFGTSEEKFINAIWKDNVNLLTYKPTGLNKIIEAQANLLHIPTDEWKKCVLRRMRVLTTPVETISEKIETNVRQLGFTREEWIKASRRNPNILLLDPQNLLKRIQENADIFQTDVQTVAAAFLKFPQFFFIKPAETRKKMAFITQMYLADLFQMKDGGVKNVAFLNAYMLRNLQLMHSLETLQLRKIYATYLIHQGKKVRMAPMSKHKSEVITELSAAPVSFFSDKPAFVLALLQNNKASRQQVRS